MSCDQDQLKVEISVTDLHCEKLKETKNYLGVKLQLRNK